MHFPLFLQPALRAGAAILLAVLAPAAWGGADDWVAVDAATLDGLRGGFTTPTGLDVSLGIERVVSINGELVSRTTFQIDDVGNIGIEQARQTSAALSGIKLIQNGDDTMKLTGFASATLAGTVIQNSLSDQRIDSRTVINASVNSMGLLKTINFQGSLSDALARTVVPR
jgi:hypothetical protein